MFSKNVNSMLSKNFKEVKRMKNSFRPLSSDELQGLISAWAEEHVPCPKHQQSMLDKIKSNIFCWIGETLVGVIVTAIMILMASADSWPI